MKFRKGDVVLVEATIISGYCVDDRIQIKIAPYHECFVAIGALTMRRAMFEVGDRVSCDGDTGTVKAVDYDDLWVRCDGGDYSTWGMAATQRLNEEEVI